MRFDFGPGYRVYYAVFAQTVILLGGDKSTQTRDIETAKHYAQIWKARYQK
jgi:putative addiction module killer protein